MNYIVYGLPENESAIKSSFCDLKFEGHEVIVMSDIEHNHGGCEDFNFISNNDSKPFFPKIETIYDQVESISASVIMEGINPMPIVEGLCDYAAEYKNDFYGSVASSMAAYLVWNYSARLVKIKNYVSRIVVPDYIPEIQS